MRVGKARARGRRRPGPLARFGVGSASREQLSEHVGQNPAVLIVSDFLRRVDADRRLEPVRRPVVATGHDGHDPAVGEAVGDPLGQPLDRVAFLAGQAQALGVVAGAEASIAMNSRRSTATSYSFGG